MGTIKGTDGEVLGTPLGASDIIKPGVDEVPGLILLGGSVVVSWVGNLEGEGNGEGDPLGNSEVTRVGNKLVISYGEVPGRLLVKFLWLEFGTEVVYCDGRDSSMNVVKIYGSG